MKVPLTLLILVALSMAVLAGCDGSFVQGSVTNVQGEQLPGVAVTLEGTDFQTLTDAMGNYRLPYRQPGNLSLIFEKTGYTPGQLVVQVDEPRMISASPVRLWVLPVSQGVYLYQNNDYIHMKPVEVEEIVTEKRGLVFGSTTFQPQHRGLPYSPADVPAVLCYLMPDARARLHRLEEATATTMAGGVPMEQSIWLPEKAYPVSLQTIDEREGLLQQLRVLVPLEEGIYAVHWGALEGEFGIERRMFLFAVGEKPIPEEPDEAPSTPDIQEDLEGAD